jgi:uncharacterized protein YggE
VKVRDLERTGELLSSVITEGANEVTQITFTIDEPEEFRKEARDIAFQNARQKAQEFATAGGFRVGRVVSATESFRSFPIPFAREESLDSGSAGGVSVPLEPGSQEVSVSIILLYEIR